MKGANGILLIAIGLLIIWAIVKGAGPCLGGALNCLFGATSATATTTKTPTITSLSGIPTGGTASVS